MGPALLLGSMPAHYAPEAFYETGAGRFEMLFGRVARV